MVPDLSGLARLMLDPITLDGLIIATLPATHFAIAHTAAGSRSIILTETPLAIIVTNAVALKKQANSALIMVNHTHLARSVYHFIKELATDETVDPIRATHDDGGIRLS